MKKLLLAALLVSCCPSKPPVTPCTCDCPAGPPPAPQLDNYCATAEEGAACCLGAKVGKCVRKECVGG